MILLVVKEVSVQLADNITYKDICDFCIENGYDDTVLLRNYDYETAFLGVTNTGQAVYDYNLMVDYLASEGFSLEEAYEWIDYNTLRAIPYAGIMQPLILYTIDRDTNGDD